MTLPNDEDLAQYEQSGDYHPDDERYKEKIRNVLEKAQIEGYSGACGEAAKAINRAFFDNEGEIAFAINRHAAPHEEYPFIGHVACKAPDGTYWDSRGKISEESLRKWAVIDIELVGRIQDTHDMCQEERFDAEIVCKSPEEEEWTRKLLPYSNNSAAEKLLQLHTAQDTLYVL